MAIVIYKCDICKREIETPRNVVGLDNTSKCNITQGCRGKLYQLKLLPDFSRGSVPDDVSGLDNWVQRKVLFNHIQAISRNEWIIEHNLGILPSVQVLMNQPIEGDEDNTVEILPTDVKLISEHIVHLIFDQPISGSAQLIARQTDPQVGNPTSNVVDSTPPLSQLSNQGEMTIATRIDTVDNNLNINLSIQFTNAQGAQPVITYGIDNQPALLSPWNDFDIVVINGVLYTVRSFSALVGEITSGVIGNGSTFKFLEVETNNTSSFRTIDNNEILILLTSEPFSNFDKITDKYINVVDATDFDLIYNSGEFFSQPSIITTTYPHIRSN